MTAASADKPFWKATESGPMHIGWGQLGYRKPFTPRKRRDPKHQSAMDKRHHAVTVEIQRRKA